MARATTAKTAASIPPPPGWYIVADAKEWIACDDPELPGIAGFAVYVRTSMTKREQRDLQEAHAEIVEYGKTWVPGDDGGDTPHRRERALVAPYILAWNALGTNAEGEQVPVPLPKDVGIDAFDCIDEDAVRWVIRVLLVGYIITGKAGGWLTASSERGDTTEP